MIWYQCLIFLKKIQTQTYALALMVTGTGLSIQWSANFHRWADILVDQTV
jgi:hypothetical protein